MLGPANRRSLTLLFWQHVRPYLDKLQTCCMTDRKSGPAAGDRGPERLIYGQFISNGDDCLGLERIIRRGLGTRGRSGLCGSVTCGRSANDSLARLPACS